MIHPAKFKYSLLYLSKSSTDFFSCSFSDNVFGTHKEGSLLNISESGRFGWDVSTIEHLS